MVWEETHTAMVGCVARESAIAVWAQGSYGHGLLWKPDSSQIATSEVGGGGIQTRPPTPSHSANDIRCRISLQANGVAFYSVLVTDEPVSPAVRGDGAATALTKVQLAFDRMGGPRECKVSRAFQ